MKRFRIYPVVFVSALIVAGGVVVRPAAGKGPVAGPVQFNRDIRPILSENCFHCHGPDPATREAGMRLDQADGLFGPRKGGRAVVKGDLKQSLLYQRIVTEDEDDVMPPPKSHKTLTAEQKALLKRWIEEGAPWQAHWSLVAPARPTVPAVRDEGWARTPIDRFVLARLGEAGLAPNAEADRRALIRRVALDLTGLPPEPADVEAFVADQSADAYEKVVDKYLASTAYGEHRARYWLDAARYADTHGLHFDNYREIWPYRDWVINAFNANMPFDRFTVEQLAGDLLPKPTLEQQVASGFLRCQITTNEGGTIAEENLVLYTRDRTETVSRVWLGLTANCAVCHDHKFDPITAKDFYSMSAFFNNATVGALDGNIKDSPPVAVVPASADRKRWEALSADLEGVKKEMEGRRATARAGYDKWLPTAKAGAVRAAVPTKELRLHAPLDDGQGATARVAVDGQIRDLPLTGAKWAAGYVGEKAAQATAGALTEVADAGDFEKDQPFTVAVWAKLPVRANGSVVARMTEKDSFRGWDLWMEGDKLGMHLVSKWDGDAIKVLSNLTLDTKKWHHLCATYDGSGKGAGVKLYVDGVEQPAQVQKDALKGSIRTAVPFKVGQRDKADAVKNLVAQDVRLYGRALSGDEVRRVGSLTRAGAILAKASEKRAEPEKQELYDWWLASNDKPFGALAARRVSLDGERAAIEGRGATTLVMGEKPEAAKAYVLYRGEYDKRRDEVAPATPGALPPFPPDAPRNRLGFAQWLLRPENPLTARVTVNRFWQELFGTGLVKTTEDFGIMGENPSHPELLDWLAVEFRESGWDVKRLIKLMVMSSAYRQSAVATPEKLAKDAENRLLSRGPRYRLDGEVIRDAALAESGLLVRKTGGPSVKPYQPPGVWEAVAMLESNTKAYKEDSGEGLYRRSLYTFWKRAAPPASMDIFNAPSREVCTVRRERTNTPLQALVTLNDPQFVEAARVLAERAIGAGEGFDARLDFMARRLLSRPMRADEVEVLRGAFEDLLAHYRGSPSDAEKLLKVGESKRDARIDAAEHAAWTMVANQLMNLDEVLCK